MKKYIDSKAEWFNYRMASHYFQNQNRPMLLHTVGVSLRYQQPKENGFISLLLA